MALIRIGGRFFVDPIRSPCLKGWVLVMANYLDLAGNLARSHLGRATKDYQTSLRQLSSGQKSDISTSTVSELNIANRASGRVDVLDIAVRNIDLSLGLLETADKGLGTVEGLVGRAKGLALQASSSNLGDVERSILDTEYQTILDEIERLSNDLTYGGRRVLRTGIQPVVVHDEFDDALTTRSTFSLIGFPAAKVGGGELTLTGLGRDNVGAAVARAAFPTFSGLQAEFRYFSGGSSTTVAPPGGGVVRGPGNGIAFFFVDGDRYVDDIKGKDINNMNRPLIYTSNEGGLGSNGAGLGYAGIPYGFLGIGFDERGNFANTTQKAVGDVRGREGTGLTSDKKLFPADGTGLFTIGGGVKGKGAPSTEQSVILRAGQSEGYGLIRVAQRPGGNDIDGGYRDVRIELTSDLTLTVEIRFNQNDPYVDVYGKVDLRGFGLSAPGSLKFGVAASTGVGDNHHRIDNMTVSAGVDAVERMRLSTTTSSRDLTIAANSAAGQIHVTDGTTESHGFLPVGLLDASVDGLTLGGTTIQGQGSALNAVRRLTFAQEQLTVGRVYIGAQAERYKIAREEAGEAIEQESVLSSTLIDTDVADGARGAALQNVLIEIGVFTLAQVEELKQAESDRLLDILA